MIYTVDIYIYIVTHNCIQHSTFTHQFWVPSLRSCEERLTGEGRPGEATTNGAVTVAWLADFFGPPW